MLKINPNDESTDLPVKGHFRGDPPQFQKERNKYWQYLNLNYVTEESDDPENPNEIIEHKIVWHSEYE